MNDSFFLGFATDITAATRCTGYGLWLGMGGSCGGGGKGLVLLGRKVGNVDLSSKVVDALVVQVNVAEVSKRNVDVEDAVHCHLEDATNLGAG